MISLKLKWQFFIADFHVVFVFVVFIFGGYIDFEFIKGLTFFDGTLEHVADGCNLIG